jgi:hypothetical protein
LLMKLKKLLMKTRMESRKRLKIIFRGLYN